MSYFTAFILCSPISILLFLALSELWREPDYFSEEEELWIFRHPYKTTAIYTLVAYTLLLIGEV